jgi:hypothetical protein
MTELNFLNGIPKEYSKEVNLLKPALGVLAEFRQEALFTKNLSDLEAKSIDLIGKAIPNLTKIYSSDIQGQNLLQDDVTGLVKINQLIINNFELNSKFFEDYSQGQYIAKLCNEINDEITEYFKQAQDGLLSNTKELSGAKNRYRTSLAKCERLYKDLEVSIQGRRKHESDEKNNYNLTIKDKTDDKVLNYLNEFEDNQAQLVTSYEEYKKAEEGLHEFTKNSIIANVKLSEGLLCKITQNVQLVIDHKYNIMKKVKEVTSDIILAIINSDLDLLDDERKYCQLKNIKYGKYCSYV